MVNPAGRAPAEQAADIHLAAVDFAQAAVAARREVHFQIGGQREVARVNFQAKPARTIFIGLRAAARGADDAFGKLFLETSAFAQVAAEAAEFFRQRGVQRETRKADGRRRQRTRRS